MFNIGDEYHSSVHSFIPDFFNIHEISRHL